MKTKIIFLTVFNLFFSITIFAQAEFWGMTTEGGNNNAGCIFKTDTTGRAQQVMYSWPKTEGSNPTYTQLCQPANGKLYGMTQAGGINENGILFEFDPVTGDYAVKIYFDGPDKGRTPNGSLIEATNGKLYGITKNGGLDNNGVIFSYDPESGAFLKIIEFDGANNGKHPYASLIQADNGKMYGTASEGGANDFGVLFEFDPTAGTITKILDFDGTGNGEFPKGTLIEASNGKLYGTTFQGGIHSEGVLFSLDPDSHIYTKLYDFEEANGSNPRNLVQADNGIIYGTTNHGGSANGGAVYAFDPQTNTYTKKADLNSNVGTNPKSSFIKASDGLLYLLTYIGGVHLEGSIVSFDPATDVLTKLMDFQYETTGSNPMGSLFESSNGKLYGMTYRGGAGRRGLLFEYQPGNNEYQILLNFNYSPDGQTPYGNLVQAGNGKLYGMTEDGGAYNYGVLFTYDISTSTYTKLLEFDGDVNGGMPYAGLVEAGNGKLYGMNPEYGTWQYGILFSYDPGSNTFIKLMDFDGENTGGYPYGDLLRASNGKLYGMTYEGGMYDAGSIFEFDPSTDTFTKLFDFDSESQGGYPNGSLIQAGNGLFYGLTSNGGEYSNGTLFSFDADAGIFVKKYDFGQEEDDGIIPLGSLEEAANEKLYGMTYRGGTQNAGILFEFDPASDSYTKKIDFDPIANGSDPYGSLLSGNDGKLYGMTLKGGDNDNGVIFAYDPETNAITKTLDFDRNNGAAPYGSMIRVSLSIEKVDTPSFAQAIRIYPIPARETVHVELGESYRGMQIYLRTVNGKLLKYYGVAISRTMNIKLDGSKGIYILEIVSEKGNATYKIIKN